MSQSFQVVLANLELATGLFVPDNMEVVGALRKIHKNYSGFWKEAQNLEESMMGEYDGGV